MAITMFMALLLLATTETSVMVSSRPAARSAASSAIFHGRYLFYPRKNGDDPPELPTLLGVKDGGYATVTVGEIFKCKCVCYSGNPRPSLLWLNHHNREISAVTTTTGSGVSSELVIRPSASDHGSVFRCHVLHPALPKPYEVSFTLQVLYFSKTRSQSAK
ncbi:cell differentiation [Tyrophagus putrescentiae]|nr:cell differentiation [Tyrophagus putrescentiae]